MEWFLKCPKKVIDEIYKNASRMSAIGKTFFDIYSAILGVLS